MSRVFASLAAGSLSIVLFAPAFLCAARAEEALDYQSDLATVVHGFDGKTTWVHARAGAIPPHAAGNSTETPIVVMTLQKCVYNSYDVYSGLYDLRTDDLGQTWTGPTEQPALARHKPSAELDPSAELEIVASDFWPSWHAKSGKLLGTGHTVIYDAKSNTIAPINFSGRARWTSYSVYDPLQHSWTDWKTMEMPKLPGLEGAGAGSTQRVDLPDGDILLPVYYLPPPKPKPVKPEEILLISAICRCRFDGTALSYLEHGDEMTLDFSQGVGEPSLIKFGDRFYLTLRSHLAAYVASSSDGLHFGPLQTWKFDDGIDLGSRDTQAHWVAHSDGLFLVYTRAGANNDHIFRHRAPLFMARVDPERLIVLRSTERVVVPERGAALGNFGITDVSPNETWIVTTEWMRGDMQQGRGSDNAVLVAKLHWNRPNRRMLEGAP